MGYEDVYEITLHEKVYFETGQEIMEMRAISLEPDIIVEAFDNYIQIRGLLILQGKYEKDTSHHEASKIENGVRYVEKVMDKSENTATFTHRFPVEISIPPERVQRLEQIKVAIDSFDYELPTKNTLILHAVIHMYGIKSEQRQKENSSEEEVTLSQRKQEKKLDKNEESNVVNISNKEDEIANRDRQNNNKKNKLMEKFAHSNRNSSKDAPEISASDKDGEKASQVRKLPHNSKEEREKKPEDQTKDKQQLERAPIKDTAPHEYEVKEKSQGERASTNAKQSIQKKLPPKEEIKTDTDVEESHISEVGTSEKGQQEKELLKESVSIAEKEVEETSIHGDDVEKDKEVADVSEDTEIDIHLSESAEEQADESIHNMVFLSELFSDTEETSAQMKLYIVQEQDTIESIAKRYDVSTLQLLKMNNVAGEGIEVGQIIYIPL